MLVAFITRAANFITERTKKQAGLMIAATIPLAFSIFFLSKYTPNTEGWWHVFGKWILQGKAPYRDFELLVPPLYPYLIAFFEYLELDNFLQLRVFGLAIILATSLVCYVFLKQIVGSIEAGLLSAALNIFIQTGSAYINYDYVYIAILFQLLTFLSLGIYHVSSFAESEKSKYLVIVSGLFAGLTLLTKQTNGIATFLLAILGWGFVSYWRTNGHFERARKNQVVMGSSLFLCGFLIVWTPYLLSLIASSNFEFFLDDVWSSAQNSKGGLDQILLGWWLPLFEVESLRLALKTVIPILIILYLKERYENKRAGSKLLNLGNDQTKRVLKLLVAIAVLVGAILGRETVVGFLLQLIYLPVIVMLLITVFGSTFAKELRTYFPLALCSISLVWASGMSAGLAESAMFLGAGTAAVFFIRRFRAKYLTSLGLVVLLASSFSVAFLAKAQTPFSWWGYSTPSVSESTHSIERGLRKGLYTDQRTLQLETKIFQNLESVEKCSGK